MMASHHGNTLDNLKANTQPSSLVAQTHKLHPTSEVLPVVTLLAVRHQGKHSQAAAEQNNC
jgi:hypothetical protein